MIKASIVSIGNELLNGHTVDTNTRYISARLLEYSVPVVSGYTVGDDAAAMRRAFVRAAEDADIVLITGGLGPTDDDLTREVMADFLGVPLICDEKVVEVIRSFFTLRGREMSETNRRQAFIPKGCEAINNPRGTAPGIFAEHDGKMFFVMPGVPSEMELMVEDFVLPKVRPLSAQQSLVVKKLRCFGRGESDIAQLLGDLMRRDRNPLINSTAGGGMITLHIIATADDHMQAEAMSDKDSAYIAKMLGDCVFGYDNQTMPEVLGSLLRKRGATLAVAESCTGGMICKMLTDVPGSSEFLTYGWVTYSNKSKTSELGVPTELIDTHGAVSEQVAMAMAQGALERSCADYSIAVTGIAGPGGGSEHKPVGTVFIAVCNPKNCECKRFIWPGDREHIRWRSALNAMNMLRLRL